MKEVWTVWIVNDDMDPLLVGVATSEKNAYEMRGKIEETFEDAFECQVCRYDTDTLNIDDKEIHIPVSEELEY